MIQQLEATITAVAARCLRTDAPIDAGMSFDLLGLDSLAAIELAAALEAELGCDLPADVLAGCTDAGTLAARLRLHLAGFATPDPRARSLAGAPRAPIRSRGARVHDDPFEQMFADAVLPEDVRPVRRVSRPTDLRNAHRILLTGATGFLGQSLLRELLASTRATVVCLVRPPNRDMPFSGGSKRLGVPAADSSRVQVVEGDLAQPRLGLSEDRYDELVSNVDSICHCGAAVNWVFSYAALRAANVLGTLELLRLACRSDAAFHFISSLSVCYAADGPAAADETFDGLPHLRAVHLGYAQTKIVAEALVREAGKWGLPVRIYRPALISGHSVTGAFNRDDLICTLVRGCVQMRTAPDLDWKLDCEPVDMVAGAIVRLSRASGPVFHLGHDRPRHWRECVLWMRMYGYDVRLISYHAWLRQLERETRPGSALSVSHPLRPLRSFFLERPAGARGLTLPELYEERRRTCAVGDATRALLRRSGVRATALDAALLDTYFDAFRAAGELPDPSNIHSRADATRESPNLDPAFFSKLLNAPIDAVEILGTGSEHSIVSELTAWRSKTQTGLFRSRLTYESGEVRDVMVKAKAHDSDVIAVGEALVDLVDPSVGRQYRKFSDRIGFAASHIREIEIYRQKDPRFVQHAPALLGSLIDDEAQTWLAVLEHVNDAVIADSADHQGRWRPQHVEQAINGAASLHAIWLGREAELRARPWIGHVQSAEGMAEMAPLWCALAEHAAALFGSWSDPDIVPIHHRLVSQVDRWWPALEQGPRTLIHNDFNPRNICLRSPNATLCAYDWELATIGAPQRDLVELLCFVLPSDAGSEDVIRWMDHHRHMLEREHGSCIDRDLWCEGFRSALYDLLINRLSVYAVVHRVRRQPFLPRVVRTWRNLYQLFPFERAA